LQKYRVIIIIKHDPQASQHHRASRELGPVLGLVWVRQHEAVPRHPVPCYFALPAVARQYTASGGVAPFARRGFMCGPPLWSLPRNLPFLSSLLFDPFRSNIAPPAVCRTSRCSSGAYLRASSRPPPRRPPSPPGRHALLSLLYSNIGPCCVSRELLLIQDLLASALPAFPPPPTFQPST
jgi:hypothetical protein